MEAARSRLGGSRMHVSHWVSDRPTLVSAGVAPPMSPELLPKKTWSIPLPSHQPWYPQISSTKLACSENGCQAKSVNIHSGHDVYNKTTKLNNSMSKLPVVFKLGVNLSSWPKSKPWSFSCLCTSVCWDFVKIVGFCGQRVQVAFYHY